METNSAKQIKILNGANLNLLGQREPLVYGSTTLQEIEKQCLNVAKKLNLICNFYQTNHEGEMVDFIQNSLEDTKGIIINAGAFTHSSIAIHDALRLYRGVVLEVHISNIYAREEFRHHSYISPIAKGIIAGFGVEGYIYALQHMAKLLENE